MPAPTISALPTVPSRTRPNLFASEADAFFGAFPALRTDINALVSYLNTNAIILGNFADGTATAPSFNFASDTNTGIFRPAADTLGFSTNGVEAFRISSTRSLLLGRTTQVSGLTAANLMAIGGNQIAAMRATANSGGFALNLSKSRGTNETDYTAVLVADVLGELGFWGADGTTMIEAASITSIVRSVAANDVRGNLEFAVATAAGGIQTTKLTLSDVSALFADPILLPNGTVAAPALAFSGNTTTGISRVAGALTFSIAGVETNRMDTNGNLLNAGGVIGYASTVGRGGAVTQLTSRTTAVTLNTASGQITMFTAAGSATPASFVVNNSLVTANDLIILNMRSGATNVYNFSVSAKAAGSFTVTFNTTGGTASDTPVLHFMVLRGTIN